MKPACLSDCAPLARFIGLYAAALALAVASVATSAGAQDVSGKLRATGGVSTVEGSGGGGLATWALISGYGTERQIGANAHLTGVRTRDYALATGGVAVGLYDRVELSYARQEFNTKAVLTAISPGLRDYRLKQDVFGAKVRVIGDAIYDQDRLLPQIAVGVQVKHNQDDTVIPFLNDALKSNIKNRGTDVYVAVSKLFLDKSLLLNGTVRLTKGNQFGLVGFEGPDGKRYRPEFEGSLAYLFRRDLVGGVEVRTKRGNLANAALNLSEGTAWDVFVAYFPSKNVSLTAAYVDLGQIVGALTSGRRQTGAYLSLQIGF